MRFSHVLQWLGLATVVVALVIFLVVTLVQQRQDAEQNRALHCNIAIRLSQIDHDGIPPVCRSYLGTQP